MGLSQALFSGISGLQNHQRRMDNIGNNLANVNTVGFKKGVHQFSTLLSQTLRGGTGSSGNRGGINPLQVGLGTNTSSLSQEFTQGALQVTGNERDLAIEGNGFFVLRTGIEGVWGYAYSRDGAFYLGTDGKLLGGEGMYVQGIQAEEGAIPEAGTLGDLTIPIGQTGAAAETTQVGMTGNLNSDQDVSTPNIISTRTTPPTSNTDSTWLANGGNDINVGHVETSAAFFDASATSSTLLGAAGVYSEQIDFDNDGTADWGIIDIGAAGVQTGEQVDTNMDGIINAADSVDYNGDGLLDGPMLAVGAAGALTGIDTDNDGAAEMDIPGIASWDTDLTDLQYLRGTSLVQPFAGAATGDQIEINWEKGGRKNTATFTYGENDPTIAASGVAEGDGTTLEDLMVFLTGGTGDDANGPTDQRLLGGAMGTIHTRERFLATDGFDTVYESAGSFLRQFVGGANPHSGAADYDNDGEKDFTTRISIASNLGAENAITDVAFTFNNINFTDIFSSDSDHGTIEGGSTTTTMLVYDSIGNPKKVTMTMSLVGRDTNFSTWRWVADSADDTDATWLFKDEDGNPIYNQALNSTAANPTSPSTSVNVGTGLIRFDSDGQYVGGSELSSTGGIEIDLENQGVNTPLSIGILEGLSRDQDQDLSFSNLTQVAAESDFNLAEQNGSPPGTLDSFTVTSDGVINGVFSNGVLETIGRISLAKVPNNQGLIQAGQNLYIEGANSGEPQIGFAGVGGRGQIRSGTLELSNVDLSEEFTNLIVTERGFQANSRVITTSDEMLVELVNLKR